MYFEAYKSILYSDTAVPDIFISEYLPSMDGDCVKVYLYCLFLSKYNKKSAPEELGRSLDMDPTRVKEILAFLDGLGIITLGKDSVRINDLKEREINKIYRVKATSTPEEASLSTQRNKKRNRIVTAINNKFFQGVMAPSWYTDIDAWFDRYKFDEDVMYALFQHCFDHKALSKQYIMKVADNWFNKNIRNSFDLDAYSVEYQKFKEIKLKIVKKLKRKDFLTEYEDEYIEKWVIEFKYGFPEIELALKKTTAISRPNFEYINKIIITWYEKGLRTCDEIIAFEAEQKKTRVKKPETATAAVVPQHKNFDQRQYDDEFFDSLYKNVDSKR